VPRRRVITERDVRLAARQGARALDAAEAAVTPAAIDAAARLGVALQGAAGGGRAARRSGKPNEHAPSGDAARGATASPPARSAEPPPAGARVLRVSLGADHGGVALKTAIAARLRELGHSVDDRGTSGSEAVDYPDFAAAVASDVAAGVADVGIMVDGAGIGSCMAANKVPGVRAAMCYDVTTAANAREHNHANVLTLGGGLLGTRLALAVVETFLATPFGGGRHAARVAKIDALDAPRGGA
jgi:ribose 5-phosphate isomerase B